MMCANTVKHYTVSFTGLSNSRVTPDLATTLRHGPGYGIIVCLSTCGHILVLTTSGFEGTPQVFCSFYNSVEEDVWTA